MADDKKKEPAAAATAADGDEEKKGGNLILVIGIIVGIVIIQTAIAYLIIPKPVDEEAMAAKAVEDSIKLAAEAEKRMGAVTIDAPIKTTVNIAGTDGERFIKAAVILEYDEKNVMLGNEIRKRIPKYIDMFSNHMANLTLLEVTDPLARDKIRKDLLRMINETLPPIKNGGKVDDVLFQEYIIQ